mgnify:CR=1 FL=1
MKLNHDDLQDVLQDVLQDDLKKNLLLENEAKRHEILIFIYYMTKKFNKKRHYKSKHNIRKTKNKRNKSKRNFRKSKRRRQGGFGLGLSQWFTDRETARELARIAQEREWANQRDRAEQRRQESAQAIVTRLVRTADERVTRWARLHGHGDEERREGWINLMTTAVDVWRNIANERRGSWGMVEDEVTIPDVPQNEARLVVEGLNQELRERQHRWAEAAAARTAEEAARAVDPTEGAAWERALRRSQG